MAGTTDLTTTARKPGWEHIPLYPRGFIGLRIAQLVLGIVALGLSAFGVWGLAIAGSCLVLFVAIATLITTVWLLVAHFAKPAIYNYWAVLALDIFLVVFWLVAFAVLASQVAEVYRYLGFSSSSSYYYYYSSSSYYSDSAILDAWLACQAAAAGVGGVLFVLFIVSLVFHSMALHRHRAAGLHCNPSTGVGHPGSSAPGPGPYADKAPAVQTYPTPAYTQPTQAYSLQQQPQPQYYDPSSVASPVSATQSQQGSYAPPPPQQQPQAYGDAQQPPQQYQQQHQYQQQQPVYSPPQTSSPAPLSVQYTGSSTAPAPVSQPQNNPIEVPAQTYQQH